jgi:hypothetical protein
VLSCWRLAAQRNRDAAEGAPAAVAALLVVPRAVVAVAAMRALSDDDGHGGNEEFQWKRFTTRQQLK